MYTNRAAKKKKKKKVLLYLCLFELEVKGQLALNYFCNMVWKQLRIIIIERVSVAHM